MYNQKSKVKSVNQFRKEIEDYYKSWVHKHFQKGIKEVKVILHGQVIVILGFEFMTFVEQSILDDDYSKQLVYLTRRKLVQKNFSILKQNLELILGRTIISYFVDFAIDSNQSCMTIFLGEEITHEASETI